ncbi:transposase [Streptomyces sp. NBC_01166]|uniref:transposase n=1 Tax=Streptomyces sp. NBC_01166 TaxID=2903755 RepID=UPI003870CB7C|nr:transposase [Streptomyces sp. NBC_01166]
MGDEASRPRRRRWEKAAGGRHLSCFRRDRGTSRSLRRRPDCHRAQWARIEPLLPDRTPKRGGRWRDHREAIDAIAFRFRTGTQWVHLPEN